MTTENNNQHSLAPLAHPFPPVPPTHLSDKLAKRREHYKQNKELFSQRARDYRKRNKARVNERDKQRYKVNNGKVQARKRNLVKRFGITWDDYRIKWIEQNGCCDICGRYQTDLTKALAVDHNHQTKQIRGLLCGDCNTGIGLLKEDSTVLRQAADYIDKWKETANN
jgi:hypothetical protein